MLLSNYLFHTVSDSDIMLASTSQDTYIRLWKISSSTDNVQLDELALKEESFISHNQSELETKCLNHTYSTRC